MTAPKPEGSSETPVTVEQYLENVFRIDGKLYVPLDDASVVVNLLAKARADNLGLIRTVEHLTDEVENARTELAVLKTQEPVAWTRTRHITDRNRIPIGLDEPSVVFESERPDDEGDWWPLYANPGPAIPDGWQLVPKEPTQAMIEAASPAFTLINSWCAEMQVVRGRKADWTSENPPLKQAWRLMMSAAPSPVSVRAEGEG